MAAPVGCGAAFVRDGGFLARALTLEPAAYVEMAPTDTGDLGSPFDQRGEGNIDYSLDHSAPPRGLAVWALLKEIGAKGMRERVVRHHDCARRVAERVRAHPALELLAEPVLSICCFRVKPAGVTDEAALEALNEKVLLAVRGEGTRRPVAHAHRRPLRAAPLLHQPAPGPRRRRTSTVDEVLAAAKELGAIALTATGGCAAVPGARGPAAPARADCRTRCGRRAGDRPGTPERTRSTRPSPSRSAAVRTAVSRFTLPGTLKNAGGPNAPVPSPSWTTSPVGAP